MYQKYGKPVADVISQKISFFDENERYLKMYDEFAEELKKCEVRTTCKICGHKIGGGTPHFESHRIKYYICPNCEHVNSMYIESQEFLNNIYKNSDFSDFYTRETKEQYDKRINDIYIPKVEFLKSYIGHEHINEVSVLDIGAGSGYFVNACRLLGINCSGIEVSKRQVEFAKDMGTENIENVDENGFIKYITETKSNIVSAIGVVEHLLNPLDFFEAINSNPKVNYVYLMVPFWGFSCILEMIFPEIFNRHLGGGHTHIFSNKSIQYICEKYKFSLDVIWRFGTDIVDLYRSCMVMLSKKGFNDINQYWQNDFIKSIDDMQVALDKNGFSSEAHLILKKI